MEGGEFYDFTAYRKFLLKSSHTETCQLPTYYVEHDLRQVSLRIDMSKNFRLAVNLNQKSRFTKSIPMTGPVLRNTTGLVNPS